MDALAGVSPKSPTACAGWTAHNIVAHLAAGAKEIADLINEKLAGRPQRPTRMFAEREAPFAAMADDQLREAMVTETRRKIAATDALAQRGHDATFEFTGRSFTAAQLRTHSRSEAAIHRWDLVGDDDASDELLAQPELTRHAVEVLNTLPSLDEAPGSRTARAGVPDQLRIVLRTPGQPDVVLIRSWHGARFELIDDRPADGHAIVTTDAANRLLTLWGRRSSKRNLTLDTDLTTPATVETVLWPTAVPWPTDVDEVAGGER